MSSQQEVATKIKDTVASLLRTRREISATEFPDDELAFSDADAEWGAAGNVGPLASMQGIRTVFNAAAALLEDPVGLWEVIEPDLISLLEEWNTTLESLSSEKGYGADPYDSGNDLSLLFETDDQVPRYTDTVSAALSTSVLINFIGKSRPTLFDSNRELQNSTRHQILTCLQIIIEAQCPDGGWSWRPGNQNGHLVFTWSAVAGLTDVFDYILGNNEKAIDIGPDPVMKDYLMDADPQILDKLRICRDRASSFLGERYLSIAKDKGIHSQDVSHDDIFITPTNDLVLIYCELYLLEGLVLTRYAEPGGVESRERKDELELLYRNIARKFPYIRRDEFSGNPDACTLTLEIRGTKLIRGKPITYNPQDGGIWAQLLRTLVLYRFYIKRDSREDPDILGEDEGALKLLLQGRRPDGAQYPGVWDNNDFNLGITIRAIEGLVDCYDYFDLLKKMGSALPQTPVVGQPNTDQLPSTASNADLASLIAEAIYPRIEQRLAEGLENKLELLITDKLGGLLDAKKQEEASPTAGLPASDIKAMRQGLLQEMRGSMSSKLIDILGDAVDGAFPTKDDLSPKDIIEELIGRLAAEQMAGQNPTAYELLKHLVWLNFNVNRRLWSFVLQETIIDRISDKDLRAQFKEKDGKEGVLSLDQRLDQALSLLADNEVSAVSGPQDRRPMYEKMIAPLLEQKSPGKKA